MGPAILMKIFKNARNQGTNMIVGSLKKTGIKDESCNCWENCKNTSKQILNNYSFPHFLEKTECFYQENTDLFYCLQPLVPSNELPSP